MLGKIYFPISLNSKEDEIEFNERILVRKHEDSEIKRPISLVNLDLIVELGKCNYLLVVDSVSDAKIFSLSLKLLEPTISGAFIGFNVVKRTQEIVSTFLYDPRYEGKIFNVSKNLNRLKTIIDRFYLAEDTEKNILLKEKFLYATSGMLMPKTNRFLEHLSILKIIAEPEEQIEYTYRFAIIITKLLVKYHRLDRYEVYNNLLDMVSIGININKEENLRKIHKYLPLIEQYSRMMLYTYFFDQKVFTPENLLDLCIKF